jgi:predicted ATPase
VDAGFINALTLAPPDDGALRSGYPWDLPATGALADGLPVHPKVTYLIGENGSGKSTLLEAVAVEAGMNAEGGSSGFACSTRQSHSLNTRDGSVVVAEAGIEPRAGQHWRIYTNSKRMPYDTSICDGSRRWGSS